MLCPHMFPNLADPSALNTAAPPAPLVAAVPGFACDVAPPFKFGWQVSIPPFFHFATCDSLCCLAATLGGPQTGRALTGI